MAFQPALLFEVRRLNEAKPAGDRQRLQIAITNGSLGGNVSYISLYPCIHYNVVVLVLLCGLQKYCMGQTCCILKCNYIIIKYMLITGYNAAIPFSGHITAIAKLLSLQGQGCGYGVAAEHFHQHWCRCIVNYVNSHLPLRCFSLLGAPGCCQWAIVRLCWRHRQSWGAGWYEPTTGTLCIKGDNTTSALHYSGFALTTCSRRSIRLLSLPICLLLVRKWTNLAPYAVSIHFKVFLKA